MTRVIQDLRRNLEVSKDSIRELESAERQGIRMDRALSRLDQASEDTALIFLDHTGRISDWRTGARRLYGFETAEMVGGGAAALFEEPERMDFPGCSLRHEEPRLVAFAGRVRVTERRSRRRSKSAHSRRADVTGSR
jgi:PAS domain S-box-containing protein